MSQIVEGAWVTAHEVMRFLELQPNTAVIIAPPADARTATPTDTCDEAAAEAATVRRKGKGKRTPVASAGNLVAERPQPHVATAPAAKVVVLSDLGTKKLVSAEEAHARATSSATAHLAIWQAPPSMEGLTRLLKRLDELCNSICLASKGPPRKYAR
ncbi:hypothetical protein RX327_33795 [Bradyrhizobium sp. BEA-2-5]|uniref:hypothetical protein n=1 Tax=Bradyrhizobium sp. BEA-2-5 TaxID=3080015 RepID=UPI00293E1DB6|nr:hypothetical protein [Bradyrhizobium sp. BEA-2-5]WOH80674.1 hypothetical protein RX327_33795 [Bradyrhizobium sp. BEA-2-5]